MLANASFRVSVSVDEATGRFSAAYFRIRRGKVEETVEVVDGRAFADYDGEGRLLGVEMIAPCLAQVVDRLGDEPEAKEFIQRSAPMQLVA